MKWCLIIVILLMSFAFLTPNHYLPWLTSHSEFSIFLSFIFLGLYSLLHLKKIIIPRFFLIFLIIILIPIIQYVLHKIYFLGDLFIILIYGFGFVFALTLGFNLADQSNDKGEKAFTILSFIFLIISLISVSLAMMQWLLMSNGQLWLVDFPSNARPFANFAQPNTLATFLLIGLMATLYLYEKKYLNHISGIIISFLIIFGVALTQSRTSWVFMICFIVWWFWKAKKIETRISTKSILILLGAYISCIILLPYISIFLDVALATDVLTRATTGLNRLAMWQQMLIAIQNQPWFGYGWNQVSTAQVMTTLEYPVKEWTEHAHNIILDLLIWNGIPIGLLIICSFGWWLYRLAQLATSTESFIALAMVGAVLVHAMLEYPLEYAFFLLPVGFLLGLVQAEDKKINVIITPKWTIAITLIISITLYVWIFIEYRIIEKDVQLARFESLNIGTLHTQQAAPDVIILTQLREQLRFIRTKPTRNMSDAQLEWMRQVSYRYATPTALFRYAQALALNNRLESAKKHLLIIEKLHGKKFSTESLYVVSDSLIYQWYGSSNLNGSGK